MKVKDTENYAINYFVELKKILEILNLITVVEEKAMTMGNSNITSLLDNILVVLKERVEVLIFILNKLGEVEKSMEIK